MKIIDGGVTTPEGYFAAGIACGIKKDGKKDLAIICSEDISATAGVFTTNVVKGHSLQVTMEHLKSGYATAIVINSGNANACVGNQGYEDAKEIARITAGFLDCDEKNILVGSTGVIGIPLKMDLIRPALEDLVENMSADGGHDALEAIMTTDLAPKECAMEFDVQGKTVVIGGIAKGSGMIHPNMATMISVITTDANISKSLLNKALQEVVKQTFNRVSVDGDTSVCDMVIIMANGMADNPAIINEDREYKKFMDALNHICTDLSKKIAKDGEGATKLIEIKVNDASSQENAYKIVNSIAKSPLVKTAIFGEDANWGRILTAAGYSGADFNPEKIDILIGNLLVCKNGIAVNFDEEKAKTLLQEEEITITVNLNSGEFSDRMWTCDFSYDYVKINGSYRS